jgi:O-antigen/teichoic acid export membrane protein
LTSFSAFELNFADRFFLQHYTNLPTVGIYALGYKFGYMLSFLLIQPFIMIWGVRMYDVAKRPDAGAVFSRIMAYFTLLICTAALAMSLLIKGIISIVASPQFHDAYKVVPAVALAYVFYGMSFYFQTGIYISKRTSYLGLMGAICALANVLFNFLLIPRFGAMGASWATALSFLLMAILAYTFSQRVYRIPYALFRTALPVATAIAIYFLSTLIDLPSSLVSLGFKLLLILGFGLAILAFGFFDDTEMFRLRQTLQIAWGRFGWGVANSTGR